MKPLQPKPTPANREQSIREMQHVFGFFEDDLVALVPSKAEILQRIKRRRVKRNILYSSVFAILGLTVGLYAYNPCYQQQLYSTALGQQQQLRLSDGSDIVLNSQTRLQVQQKLRSRELILLEGEASFRVQHQQPGLGWLERAFVVTAGQMHIRDIGTVFNVHKQGEHSATVTVLQGAVAVSFADAKPDEVVLHQGQLLRSEQMPHYSINQQADLSAVLAWQSRTVMFNQTPLHQVITELQRYAKFELEYADAESRYIPINGQFKTDSYQEFLQLLPLLAGLKIEQTAEDQWRISK